MIYEQAMLEHNYRTEIIACLLDLGFVEVPSTGEDDPAKYYYGPDTRREFYLYFSGTGGVEDVYCHITTNEGEYDYRLSPWIHNSCLSMATWTRLYGGGIRFGIRAEKEFLIGFESESLTDYKLGYRNEELYSAFMPAHWFAIIAPEDPERDQWIYIVYQRLESASEGEFRIRYNETASIFTEEGYINEYYNENDSRLADGYILNGDGTANNIANNDFFVAAGTPQIIAPYMWGIVTWRNNSVSSVYYTKIYNNIFHVIETGASYTHHSDIAMNRVFSYNKKNYINISENNVIVRYE